MRGRSHRTAKKRQKLLEVIASGFSVSTAARAAGMSRRSVFDWKAADPAFARELEEAYEEGTDRISDEVLRLGRQPGNLAGLIFTLKQRDPKRFNQKMVEVLVTGDASNPVAVSHSIGRPRVVILPSNSRPSLTETEIIAEREAVSREASFDGTPLLEAAAEVEPGE